MRAPKCNAAWECPPSRGRAADAREKESPLPVYDPKVEGRGFSVKTKKKSPDESGLIGSDRTARRRNCPEERWAGLGKLGLAGLGLGLKKKRTGPRPVSRRAAEIGGGAAATRLGAAVLAPGRRDDGRNGRGSRFGENRGKSRFGAFWAGGDRGKLASAAQLLPGLPESILFIYFLKAGGHGQPVHAARPAQNVINRKNDEFAPLEPMDRNGVLIACPSLVVCSDRGCSQRLMRSTWFGPDDRLAILLVCAKCGLVAKW
ncbi:hypothetical protein CRG98_004419 [Punica granatum]|uniref:Uncharacterized protein n=1 Tax=Punica granatum TaxID=22663 RepID=A0A2I0L3A8_PUNGR|nr:hypothetical protein CRG98_004419 [Punica granatum]